MSKSGAVKIISMFCFRSDKPYQECKEYWLTVHPDVVKRCLPEVRRYVQNIPIPVSTKSWEYDGISELWFDDMDSVRRSFEGPLADELRADEAVFVHEDFPWILVTEDVVTDSPVVAPPE